jgi:glycosidase
MPIHPSPTYHGYDVLDYYGVNSEYGTMEDFELLLEESDKVGINIIIDLVVNHSSSQHPWFTGWKNGDSQYAGFYRSITASDSRYDANPGLWHSMGDGEYYAGFFGGSMPDLNWSNPVVQQEMIDIALYWMEKGVDGFRLDAALHIEDFGEVKPPTVGITSTLNKLEYFEYMIEEQYPDVYIVGEVWSSLSEFSKFHQSMDSALNFETGGDILSVINRGYSTDYVENLVSNYNVLKAVDPNAIDAPFLFNHDQDRIASILNGNDAKLKLAAEMLLTLEGNPYIYYGEELGMFGIKTLGPTIWDETRRLPLLLGTEEQTSWMADNFNSGVNDIPTQLQDENSILNVYRTLLNVRKESLALKYGVLELSPENNNALQAYTRTFTHDGELIDSVLVLHNVTESEYDYGMTNSNVIYYSGGVENFTGLIAPRSTVIIQLDTE